MGNSRFARCFQGGGVWVQGGTVAISSCTISGNTAFEVLALLKSSHRPPGRLTFCSLFAGRRCLRLLRHYHDHVFLDLREFSFQGACSCSKVPIAPLGDSRLFCWLFLQGGGVCCVVFGGTVAISSCTISGNTARGQHGGGVLVQGLGTVTISSCTISGNTVGSVRVLTLSKVLIAPMGKLLTCLPRLTLAQLRTLRSIIQGVRAAETLKTSHHPDGKVADVLAPTHACTTANPSVNYTGGARRRDLENFPSSRWESC